MYYLHGHHCHRHMWDNNLQISQDLHMTQEDNPEANNLSLHAEMIKNINQIELSETEEPHHKKSKSVRRVVVLVQDTNIYTFSTKYKLS